MPERSVWKLQSFLPIMRTWIALLPVTTLALRRRVPERHVQPLVSTHLTFEPLEHILLGACGDFT